MKISKSGIGKIAVEFTSVVFAVLLALGLNHWRENMLNERLADDSTGRIQNEIRANLDEIDTSIKEFDSLISDIQNQRKRLDSLGNDFDGVEWAYSHPVLSNDAWTTATITNAVLYMDHDLVEDMADLYTVQEFISWDHFVSDLKEYS